MPLAKGSDLNEIMDTVRALSAGGPPMGGSFTFTLANLFDWFWCLLQHLFGIITQLQNDATLSVPPPQLITWNPCPDGNGNSNSTPNGNVSNSNQNSGNTNQNSGNQNSANENSSNENSTNTNENSGNENTNTSNQNQNSGNTNGNDNQNSGNTNQNAGNANSENSNTSNSNSGNENASNSNSTNENSGNSNQNASNENQNAGNSNENASANENSSDNENGSGGNENTNGSSNSNGSNENGSPTGNSNSSDNSNSGEPQNSNSSQNTNENGGGSNENSNGSAGNENTNGSGGNENSNSETGNGNGNASGNSNSSPGPENQNSSTSNENLNGVTGNSNQNAAGNGNSNGGGGGGGGTCTPAGYIANLYISAGNIRRYPDGLDLSPATQPKYINDEAGPRWLYPVVTSISDQVSSWGSVRFTTLPNQCVGQPFNFRLRLNGQLIGQSPEPVTPLATGTDYFVLLEAAGPVPFATVRGGPCTLTLETAIGNGAWGHLDSVTCPSWYVMLARSASSPGGPRYDIVLEEVSAVAHGCATATCIAARLNSYVSDIVCYHASSETLRILADYLSHPGFPGQCHSHVRLHNYMIECAGGSAGITYHLAGKTEDQFLYYDVPPTDFDATIQVSAPANDWAPAQPHFAYHAYTYVDSGQCYDPTYGRAAIAEIIYRCPDPGNVIWLHSRLPSISVRCQQEPSYGTDSLGPGCD